ncbi:Crp/Fnr family transcriptional regulator [Mangrovibacterium lignilyticum]|uniref:Crp/Fnr family transcriptional regulator n=1 Tax=Mangrovibacterium lignilyticum TaxID=2668052 RepID=UPI0013D641C9|nr:cyclic nucleotide-binding domain-containing protein [Mangrovibacterium lignilyticum]
MNNSITLPEHIKKFIGLNPDEEKVIQKVTKTFHLRQSDFLLRKNQTCLSHYYVNSGCLRMYFLDEHSIEHILQFAIEGWWITDYNSLIRRHSSEYYIQATEQSVVIELDKDSYGRLIKKIPKLGIYFNNIMQINLAAVQTKTKFLRTMSNEELYLHFSNSFPAFVDRVPKEMVESYLGIFA